MKKIDSLFRRVLPVLCVGAGVAAFVFLHANAQTGGPNDGLLKIPDPILGGDSGGAPPPPAPERTPSALDYYASESRRNAHHRRGLAATPPPIVAPSTTGDTIVDTTQRVQATKRGRVRESHVAEDFIAMGKGVSWFYNWAANSSDTPPVSAHMQFIPMAWGHGGDPGGGVGRAGAQAAGGAGAE